jgi:signal transduction histidine kinase
MNRLLRTTAIRLALRYALFYGLMSGIALGVLFWATLHYTDREVASGLQEELARLVAIDRTEGRQRLLKVMSLPQTTASGDRLLTVLAAPDGSKLAGDLNGWPSNSRTDGAVHNLVIEDPLLPSSGEDPDDYLPVIATQLSDKTKLLVAGHIRDADDPKEFIETVLLLTLLAITVLSLALGWRMGRTMLARVDQVNRTAHYILHGDLHQRVPVSGRNDEFDDLAQNLNEMLVHIERLVEGMREVTDNVAHDLRRPLTRVLNRVEVTLLEPRDREEYENVLKDLRDDVDGMIHTFNALLEIAQTEAGSYRGNWGRIDLSEVAERMGVFYRDLVEEHRQSLTVSAVPNVCIDGNRHLIEQSVSNLLENAYKYAGEGARLELRVETDADGKAAISVIDSGPGIPVELHRKVLERFVRLDGARSSAGSGLGLALVAAVAKLHSATLALQDNRPGLSVRMTFDRVSGVDFPPDQDRAGGV